MSIEADKEKEMEKPLFDFLKPSEILSFGRRKKNRPDKKYASFNRRMMAVTFDSLLLLIFTPLFNRLFPIRLPSLPMDNSDPDATEQAMHAFLEPAFLHSWLANMGAQLAVFCLFSAICWHYWSRTPGKMLVSIRVADAKTEQPITDKQIVTRAFGYVIAIAFFFIGVFWIGVDKRRQGWHDKIADTVVLTVPWRETFENIRRLFKK